MTCAAPLLLAIVLSGASFSAAQIADDRLQVWELLRILSEKPWMALNRWDRLPRVVEELGPTFAHQIPANEDTATNEEDDDSRLNSDKRSAVATALNTGRRRRQPAPALGKAVTPYVGVGVLNDVGLFFGSLRDNLETFASLSPQERSSLFQNTPSVVRAPSYGSGGGGTGIRRLHALRPLKPSGNIRSYNRRSDVKTYGTYPGANHHDPGLLWTGLGR